MIEFTNEHFWFLLYWILGYSLIVDFHYRKIKEKGKMKKLTAFLLILVSLIWLPLVILFVITGIAKAVKRG